MTTFLITGVTGFLGKGLAKMLLGNGYNVIGIGRSECPKDLEAKQLIYLRGSISKEVLAQLNEYEISGVFHLASQQPSSSDLHFEDFYKGNVQTTSILIDYFKNRTIDFFVYTSTISVFGKKIDGEIDENLIPSPENYYSITKYLSEKILQIESKNWPTKVVVLRLQSIFGMNDGYGIVHTFYEQISKGNDIELFSNGTIHRNLVLREDVIHALVNVIHKYLIFDNFEVFQIASSNSLTTKGIAQIIKDHLKSESKIICIDKKYMFDWDVFVNTNKAKEKLSYNPNSLENAILNYLKQRSNEL